MPFEQTTLGKGVNRKGRVFTLRLEPDVEKTLKARMLEQNKQRGAFAYSFYGRHGSLGAFILAMALKGSANLEPAAAVPPKVLPASSSTTTKVLPSAAAAGTTKPRSTLKSLNKLYGERARTAAAKKKAKKKSPGHKLASSRKGKAAGFLQYPKKKKKGGRR